RGCLQETFGVSPMIRSVVVLPLPRPCVNCADLNGLRGAKHSPFAPLPPAMSEELASRWRGDREQFAAAGEIAPRTSRGDHQMCISITHRIRSTRGSAESAGGRTTSCADRS